MTAAIDDMGDKPNKEQRDIRDWVSSPGESSGTPSRRRRVMSTSDSEEERNLSAQRPLPLPHTQNDMINDGNQPEIIHSDAGDVINLSSSSEDSMYIPPPRQQTTGGAARPARQQASGGAARPVRRNIGGPRARVCRPDTTGKGRRCSGKKQSQKSKPNFSAEAEEWDTTEDSSDCDESDPDAQCLYRQAMNGVRNAGNARNNLRRATINCPVCALFAEYLQHFLSN